MPKPDPGDVISHSGTLGKVLNETSRLHPISPVINRLATRRVRLGGWVIPKGTMVCPCIYLLHRNPALGNDLDQFVFYCRPLRPDSGFLPFGWRQSAVHRHALCQREMRVILTQVELSPNSGETPGLCVRARQRRAGRGSRSIARKLARQRSRFFMFSTMTSIDSPDSSVSFLSCDSSASSPASSYSA